MTQQSQRPRGHATVVAQAGPSSQTYVHQHQCFTLEEAVASSAGHPLPPLTPAAHLLQTTVPSAGWGGGDGQRGTEYFFFFLNVGYMCFRMARATGTTADARAPAPLPASLPPLASRLLLSPGQPCLHKELPEPDFLDRLIMLG